MFHVKHVLPEHARIIVTLWQELFVLQTRRAELERQQRRSTWQRP